MISLRPALCFALVSVVFAACTTSFDLAELPSAQVPSDGGIDRPAPSDVQQVDGPPPSDVACGAAFGPCCPGASTDGGARACSLESRAVCSQGVCVPCAGSLSPCDGACVDTQTNSLHCGACGTHCPDGYECQSGSCRLACATGLTVCGGRCVSTLINPEHCGMCGNRCPATGNAEPTCQMGTCGVSGCRAGYADCDRNPANGCETNTLTSVSDCGACGRACGGANRTPACTNGVCGGTCATGFADCDGDAANGCETDTRANTDHCGACGNTCTATSGTALCVMGACAVSTVTCAAGRGDCNNVSTDNCETDLSTVMNCGRCGVACALPNATTTCTAGECRVAACATGYRDCDLSAANGCEVDVRSNMSHCGMCGRACALAHATAACANMTCAIGSCDPGWADCDRNPANGCEVDLGADRNNCGACGAACTLPFAGAMCTGGQCQIVACEAGHGNCDHIVANGCEIDHQTNAANCGVCNAACFFQNGTAGCTGGACTLTGCGAGFADCDMNPVNGCEVNTQTDAAHCGMCGRACALANVTAARCAGGQCAVGTCAAGFADCDASAANGCESSTATDVNHCGRCGNRCTSGQVCSNGTCVGSCMQTTCGASCVDLQTDVNNCGACGRRCAAAPNTTATCAGGACGFVCNPGFGNCDSRTDNGCEQSLTSQEHCGMCGSTCRSTTNQPATCATGACVRTCNPGFGDCDGRIDNGCEVNTNTSMNNCGRCGAACAPSTPNTNATCTQGTCQSTCRSGYRDCDMNPANGCESQSSSDARNCAFCGVDCTMALRPANTVGSCMSSACRFTCAAGYADCDGAFVLTGCETSLTTDRNNCGMCGRRCMGMERCDNGTCRR
jgi:hypothetical protein